ncbi:hypothetical protein ACFS6H_05900 [Terrimonas rubra]|uniref:Uncharacterized protein n=1 Tax=Terrimonas rubra TaxID=1035890 RepID=A0ABW6A441_9BACT
MVKPYHGYDIILIRRLRITLTILIWIVWAIILFLQHETIIHILQSFFGK